MIKNIEREDNKKKKKAKAIMDFSNVTRDRIYIEKWHSFFNISICRVKYILNNKLAYWINSVDVILHRYTCMYVRFLVCRYNPTINTEFIEFIWDMPTITSVNLTCIDA